MLPVGTLFPILSGVSPDVQPTIPLMSFNGYDILNANISAYSTNLETPEIRYSETPKPRSNGDIEISTFFGGRRFSVSLWVTDSTKEGLQSFLDLLKKNILNKTDYFQYTERDGSNRKMKARCTGISIQREHYNITFQNIVLSFDALDSFWSDISTVSTSFNISDTSHTTYLSTVGSADIEPVYYFVFGLTSPSYLKLTVGDLFIERTGEIQSGSYVIIDSKNMVYSLGGSETLDYTGVFPELKSSEINKLTLETTGWNAYTEFQSGEDYLLQNGDQLEFNLGNNTEYQMLVIYNPQYH